MGNLPSDTGSETEDGSWLQEGVAREFVMLWILPSSLGLYSLSKEATCVWVLLALSFGMVTPFRDLTVKGLLWIHFTDLGTEHTLIKPPCLEKRVGTSAGTAMVLYA